MMTTLDESRARIKNQQNHGTPHHYSIDYVDQKPNHGSPYHVYPYPSPVPLQHAFQPPPYPINSLHSTYSPKALPKQIMELGGKQYGSPITGSPILSRGYSLTPKGSPIPNRMYSKIQDAAITLTADTEALVAKIGSMFPTVSETHIKILLKKYYNREAVVISALQVEKHPISTPGPFTTPPSGGSRLQAAANAALLMARGGGGGCASPTPPPGQSPRASPPLRPNSGSSGTYTGSPRSVSSRPHSSPKMKLRYLKSMFPKAEETLILDMLASEENNVQKTSEKLVMMGYFKRDTMPQKPINIPENQKSPPPVTPPRLKSIEDKQALKVQLQKKYNTIPERVVSIALESVDWSQERAETILSVVLQEDVINKKIKDTEDDVDNEVNDENDQVASSSKVSALPSLTPVAPPLKCLPSNGNQDIIMDKTNRRQKNRKELTKLSNCPNLESASSYKSKYISNASGPDPSLNKGAQDQLLLTDYVTWNGANPDLKTSSLSLAKGSLKVSAEEKRTSLAKGSNKDLYKGPSTLAKGSIYHHINDSNNIKVGGD